MRPRCAPVNGTTEAIIARGVATVATYRDIAMAKVTHIATVTRLSTGLSAVPLLHLRIEERRKQIGMSQAALARRVGIHKSAMTRIEKGEQTASPLQLAAIAAALGVSLPWLMLNDGPPPEPIEIGPDDGDRRFRPSDPPDPDVPETG